jgi:hypothetical protein
MNSNGCIKMQNTPHRQKALGLTRKNLLLPHTANPKTCSEDLSLEAFSGTQGTPILPVSSSIGICSTPLDVSQR